MLLYNINLLTPGRIPHQLREERRWQNRDALLIQYQGRIKGIS